MSMSDRSFDGQVMAPVCSFDQKGLACSAKCHFRSCISLFRSSCSFGGQVMAAVIPPQR